MKRTAKVQEGARKLHIIRINDIEGIKTGHAQNYEGGTGVTVVLCEEGACGGVDVRGGAPGTRETDLLDPQNQVDRLHGVFLAGGSAFGLDAAAGIMEYLEKRGYGFDVGVTRVPIVAGAVLFDLVVGDPRVRPDRDMGYRACVNAERNECPEGNAGAGTGATVGKYLGLEYAMKGGLGAYALQVGELKVGAVVAVNCLGDVVDPATGKIIAGALNNDKKTFAGTEDMMVSDYSGKKDVFRGNTTIGVVVTNGILTKAGANKVASMAHNGFGQTIRPAHTMFDGDTIFTMAAGRINADINVVGLLAVRATAQAVIRAVKSAECYLGFKSVKGRQ